MEVYIVPDAAMEPEYYEGDTVTFQRVKELDFGDIGIFLAGTELIMREYGPGGLYAKNPNYTVLPMEGMMIIGKTYK